jgi:hypothetical protein
MLSTVANLTSAQLDVPTRRALALSQLCSPLATPWVSEGFDFPQHCSLYGRPLYIVPPRLGSYCIADYLFIAYKVRDTMTVCLVTLLLLVTCI